MNIKILRILFIIIFIVIRFEVHAQLSINKFLQFAQSDVSLKVYDDQIGYLQQKPYRLSPLREMDLRAQNNEINSPNQRYGVRVSPANPFEMRSNNKYYQTYQERLSLEKEMAFKKALKERYALVVSYLFFIELKSLREKDKSLLDSQLSILEKQQFSDFFDADDFIELKLEQMSKSVELDGIAYDISNHISKVAKVSQVSLSDVNWDMNGTVSVLNIEKVVDSLIKRDVPSSRLAYESNKINLAQRQYALEKANINIGFIQASYTEGRISKNPWGFSAGVNIPITNPNKSDMARRQLAVIEARDEKVITENSISVEKKMQLTSLQNTIQRYYDMEKKINSINVSALSKTLSTTHNNNPTAVIKFSSNVLKLQMILLKLKQDIFISYLEFLSINDHLQQTPLINYLSASLNKIEEE